jgi:RNA polymerase-binding transcription factor DksA
MFVLENEKVYTCCMDIEYYKNVLEHERALLEEEMRSVGAKEDGEVWEVKDPALDIAPSDENELADKAEEMQTSAGILENLSAQHLLVMHALKKLESGTFGVCEVCGALIEEERLSVNPSARTCLAHVDEEDTLPLVS